MLSLEHSGYRRALHPVFPRLLDFSVMAWMKFGVILSCIHSLFSCSHFQCSLLQLPCSCTMNSMMHSEYKFPLMRSGDSQVNAVRCCYKNVNGKPTCGTLLSLYCIKLLSTVHSNSVCLSVVIVFDIRGWADSRKQYQTLQIKTKNLIED